MHSVSPIDLPVKSGFEKIPQRDFALMADFIDSGVWDFSDPVLEDDCHDPLLKEKPLYGQFMLGFDFHLTTSGPRLIEINTNAGGFATCILLSEQDGTRKQKEESFVQALLDEYALAFPQAAAKKIFIIDDAIEKQAFYPEMLFLADVLMKHGIHTQVKDARETHDYLHAGNFIYNRLTDFRLTQAEHQLLRDTLIKREIALSPHPAIYARIADKRSFLRLKHPLVPETHLFNERKIDDWHRERKHWIFKPAASAGSKGVYRGDKISRTRLETLGPDTVVQALAEPKRAEDGSKYDIRIYTHGKKILGMMSRHFRGQVMGMAAEGSGARLAKVI